MSYLWNGKDRFFQIKDWLDIFDGKTILEIGVGGGDISRYLSKRNIAYGLDINIDFLKRAKANIDSIIYVQANAKNLPFRPKSFDVVICREVIEHMVKREGYQLLKEISMVLKTNGILLISTPNKLSLEGIISSAILKIIEKEWNAWDPAHKYIYNTFEFKQLLKKHNFSIMEIRGEYYLFLPIPAIAKSSSILFKFLKKIREISDNKLGHIWPVNNFGFVIEYICKKK